MIAYIYRVVIADGYEWFPVAHYDQAETLFNRWRKQQRFPVLILDSIDMAGRMIHSVQIKEA